MRLIRTSNVRGQYSVGVVLVALALAVLALAGAATNGRAAGSPGVVVTSFTVLNDDGLTIPGQPSPGGNIGYDIQVSNNGTSVANHISLSQTIGSTGTVVYVASTGISCPAVTSTPTSTLTCQISKLAVGASFDITVLFRTDSNAAPGSAVTDTAVLAFDSQTNGVSNQKTVTQQQTRILAGELDGSAAESLALHGEKLTALAAAGVGQTSDITMPDGFVNGFNFVGASLQNGSAPALCLHCPAFKTQITIPTATTFTTSGPFFNTLGTADPFSWKLVLPGSQVPNGYKLRGVFHNDSVTPLPLCSLVPAALTVDGVCVVTLQQDSKTKEITATGLGLSNGIYRFG